MNKWIQITTLGLLLVPIFSFVGSELYANEGDRSPVTTVLQPSQLESVKRELEAYATGKIWGKEAQSIINYVTSNNLEVELAPALNSFLLNPEADSVLKATFLVHLYKCSLASDQSYRDQVTRLYMPVTCSPKS